MKVSTFPAFRNNGMAVQLAEVLAAVPENDFVWSILEFNGMGEAPDSLSINDFEELVSSKPGGLMMSWNELKKISDNFDQTIDCLIVGARTSQDILNARKAGDDFSSCEVVLSLFDSTEWSVWACDSELTETIARVY